MNAIVFDALKVAGIEETSLPFAVVPTFNVKELTVKLFVVPTNNSIFEILSAKAVFV